MKRLFSDLCIAFQTGTSLTLSTTAAPYPYKTKADNQMETSNQATPPENDETNRTAQLVSVIEPITDRVKGIVGKVKWLAWIYLVGAAGLWATIFLPFTPEMKPFLTLAFLLLLLLGIPSGILFLFHFGLQSVIDLPARLLEKAGIGEASARTMIHAVKASNPEHVDSKKKKLVGTVFELRKLVTESKDMLIEYTALLRLANPFVLAIVGIATLAGFGITVAALIGVIIGIV